MAILTHARLDKLSGSTETSYLDTHYFERTPVVIKTTGEPARRYSQYAESQAEAKARAERLQQALAYTNVEVRVNPHLARTLSKDRTYWKIEALIPEHFFRRSKNEHAAIV